jgi:hypothetical protein
VNSDISRNIEQMLERYGQALSTGDTQAILSCWEVPALVLSDQGAIAITDPAQIEAFFSQAASAYQAQGLLSTRPEVERIEMLTETIAAVDVRWPAFDSSGKEMSSERSHYIVQPGKDGQMRIRLALTRTA